MVGFFLVIFFLRRFSLTQLMKLCCIFLSFLIIYHYMGQSFSKRLSSAALKDLPALYGSLSSMLLDLERDANEPNASWENVVAEGIIYLRSENQAFFIIKRESGFAAYTIEGEPIPFVHDKLEQANILVSAHPAYSDLKIKLRDPQLIGRIMTLEWKRFSRDFILDNQGFKIYVWGTGHDSVVAPYISFIPNQIFSRRGYIWSRSIPMLQSNLIWGQGYGAFALFFPQTDFSGKQNIFPIEKIIEKPHNMYLQIALGGGILSLFCFLYVIGISCKLFIAHARFQERSNVKFTYLLGLFSGICSYLVAGIANDSTIFVAPIFWLFLGVLLGNLCQPKVQEEFDIK